MKQALHTTVTVQSGRRIEIDVPELDEGELVEVFMLPTNLPAPQPQKPMGVADYLRSLPPSGRTDQQWRQLDEAFQKDRDEWDR